jgi:uncharacterized repeat protein (TIGR03803 family)
MNTRWLALLSFAASVVTSTAVGTLELTRLHSFGFADSSAANPYAELILGSDGALYGTTAAGGPTGQGTVFRINQDGTGFEFLKLFGLGTNDGRRSLSAVIEGGDGALYGTTEEGGQFGFGTIFRMSKDGSSFTVLKSFTGGPDGAYPEARLLQGSDGLLYGTASGGGTNDNGIVFKLATDGSGFASLVQFAGTNGANPESGLIEASDGLLYGTTCAGTSTNLGGIFSLQKDGGAFRVLQLFLNTSSIKTNGASPQARLLEGRNGMLYGTTAAGGTNATGTIYQINKDGTGFNTLYQFGAHNSSDGRIPLGDLILGSDGLLYGTTFDGGTNGSGTIYRIGQDGSGYSVVANLGSPQGPAGGIIESTNGILYGTTQLGGDVGAGTVFNLQKDGGAVAILRSFSASGGDGQSPYASLTSASNNPLIGTTRTGGSLAQGSIYSLRFDGLGYTLLSSLESPDFPTSPVACLVEATNGNLYGVTRFGGSSNNGTLFNLNLSGANFGTVYSSTNIVNGTEFRGGLIQASDGALYGTTVFGGSGGDGVVFRASLDASEYTVLKNFSFGSTGPGANPMQPLLEARDGLLYGTTYCGGISNRGVVFSLAKDGSTYNVLKSFGSPPTDGESPMTPLLEASDGMLYGAAYGGGGTNNAGTVFRLNRDGTSFQVILSFSGLGSDGRHPCGRLTEWTDGALYGTTERGGVGDQGIIFRVNKNGSGYSVLASFSGALGAYPRGGLVQGTDDALYGTTDQGGDLGFGTVFRFGSPFGEITALRLLSQVPTLDCVGLPGTNYILEHTLQLGPNASWMQLYATNAPTIGKFTIFDQTALARGSPQTFYRLRH